MLCYEAPHQHPTFSRVDILTHQTAHTGVSCRPRLFGALFVCSRSRVVGPRSWAGSPSWSVPFGVSCCCLRCYTCSPYCVSLQLPIQATYTCIFPFTQNCNCTLTCVCGCPQCHATLDTRLQPLLSSISASFPCFWELECTITMPQQHRKNTTPDHRPLHTAHGGDLLQL